MGKAVRFIAIAGGAYLGTLFAVGIALGLDAMDAMDGKDASLGPISLTIADPATGATLLGLFAGLVIALNVSAWSIRMSNPPV